MENKRAGRAANMRDLPATVEAARKQIATDWQRYYPGLNVRAEERQAANNTLAGIQAIIGTSLLA